MKKPIKTIIMVILIFACSATAFAAGPTLQTNKKLSFWDQQRKGANGDGGAINNSGTTPDAWFKAASEKGLEYVRLYPIDWKAEKKDFLIGNADHFTKIPEQDLQKLISVLDTAQRYNVKILLTMFSLPGQRYRQHNNNQFDYRIWTNKKYQQQALNFWKELATALKDHPAIVGYNPLNKPFPARKDGFMGEDARRFKKWLSKNKGTTADLNYFNRSMVKAIRSVDKKTPIVLDTWFHSNAKGYRYMAPIKDKAVLYAFHYYGPRKFVTYRINKGRYSYPDNMPAKGSSTEKWNITELGRHVLPVVNWAKRFNVPESRIIVEEFGADRRVDGAKQYLQDLITLFNAKGWHWAYSSFRSSDWDGLDYELGTEKLEAKYWKERENGISHEKLVVRKDNPLWDIFKKEFEKK